MSDNLRLSMSSGVASRLARYRSQKGREYEFILSGGDLDQMSVSERTLRHAGFDVGDSESGTYPALRTQEDYIRAITHLWTMKTEGWWNLRDNLVKHGIATEEEFQKALNAEVS